jgi:hypothetical protein
MTNIIATIPADSIVVLATAGTGFILGVTLSLAYAFERPLKAFFSLIF